MNCDDFSSLFTQYLENELDAQDKKDFENHLNTCKNCETEFTNFKKMLKKLKTIQDIEPPKDLKSKIIKQLNTEDKKAKVFIYKKYTSVAAILIAVIVTFAFTKLNNVNTTNEQDYAVAEASQSDKARSIDNLDTQEDTNFDYSNMYYKEMDIYIQTDNTESLKNMLYTYKNISFNEDTAYLIISTYDFLDLMQNLNSLDFYAILQDEENITTEINTIIEENNSSDTLIKLNIYITPIN